MQVVVKKRKLPLTLVKDSRKPENAPVHSRKLEDFYEWLDNALPGEKFCYFSGAYVSGKPISKFIKAVYERGLITMCQSKEGNTYHYWAVKTALRRV